MGYKLAIFDFDGTLANSFPFFVSVFNRLARQHQFKSIAPEEIPSLRQFSAREMMRYVGLPAWKFPLVGRSYIRLMEEQGAEVALFDGIGDALQHLAGTGVQLAIVSSNSRANVERVLGESNRQLIGCLECGASVFGKAARLRRVLRASGVAAAEAIYVGDQSTDQEAARCLGMPFGAVAWGYGDPAALERLSPEESFATVADLRRIAG